MDVVSYCVYSTRQPVDENDNCLVQEEKCEEIIGRPVAFSFYSINPNFKPIPNGMLKFAIKNNWVNSLSTEVRQVRDPYEQKQENTYLLVWPYPVQNSIPLIVVYSPVEQRVRFNTKIVPPTYTEKWTWYVIDGKMGPNFQFGYFQRLCLPVSVGTTLSACVQNDRDDINPTVLQYTRHLKPFPEEILPKKELLVLFTCFLLFFLIYAIKILKKEK